MRPNRLMIMLGGCLLAGSAACADELGFVDCASHSETTPVFAKARKSQDIVANVACGERFKVIVYGFVFSEVQTSDGKIGFIYSNVMTVDRSGGALQARAASSTTPTLSAASDKTKIYAEPRQSTPPAPVQAAPAPVTPPAASDSPSIATAPAAPSQPSATTASQPSATAASTPGTSVEAQLNPPAAAAAHKPAPAPVGLPGPDSVLKATSTNGASTVAPADSNAAPLPTPTPAPAPPQPATADASAAATPAAAAPTAASAPAPTAAADSMPKTDATNAQPEALAAQPQPPADAQPQPAPPAEVQPAITPAVTAKQRWEKPNPGARSASLLELYGGFAFARMSNGSGYPGTNFMGGMGSFGVNLKPWMQIVGDTSYSFESATGVKNVVYGNHYGPRFFLRGRSKWSISPFGEVLVGGSRADTTITGPGGYTVSQNCFSIKAGGGVDIRPSRMFEIRLVDVDYYRTALGTNVHQSNYWISTGVVIRLLKPWWE